MCTPPHGYGVTKGGRGSGTKRSSLGRSIGVPTSMPEQPVDASRRVQSLDQVILASLEDSEPSNDS